MPGFSRKKVFIRIGFPKTGATSSQMWLTENEKCLLDAGILYPTAGRGTESSRYGHHLLAVALEHTPLSALERSWTEIEALQREIVETSAHTIVISSEKFSALIDPSMIEYLARKLADFDVKIVCYLRRQDEFVISLWSTAVAYYGETQPISNYFSYDPLDYSTTLARWACAFGASSIVVRVYEPSQLIGGNSLTDLFSVCGIDMSILRNVVIIPHQNERIPSHLALIMSYLNTHNADPGVATGLREIFRVNVPMPVTVTIADPADFEPTEMAPFLFGRRPVEISLLQPAQRAEILAKHADGNAKVARSYLSRSDGRLFDDLSVDYSSRDTSSADLATGDSKLAGALGCVIADVRALVIHLSAKAHAPPPIRPLDLLPNPRLMPAKGQITELPDAFRALSDDAWLATLLRTVTDPEIEGFRFPRFPESEVQAAYVGNSDKAGIHEAFNFYIASKGYSTALGMPLAREMNFLDFGTGWGRFPRIFWKDILASNLYGCDVDPDAIAICEATGVPGVFNRLYPRGKLPYPDDYLGGGIAYSVFTHLSEEAHLHWMRELGRVLRPGAVFCMTLEPRRFAEFIEQIPSNSESPWHKGLRVFADQTNSFRDQFDSGRFAYLPTGGGLHRGASEYGDAIVPPSYIEKAWAKKFSLRAYIDDESRFAQAVAVMQRK
jgi:hypothetical protein